MDQIEELKMDGLPILDDEEAKDIYDEYLFAKNTNQDKISENNTYFNNNSESREALGETAFHNSLPVGTFHSDGITKRAQEEAQRIKKLK